LRMFTIYTLRDAGVVVAVGELLRSGVGLDDGYRILVPVYENQSGVYGTSGVLLDAFSVGEKGWRRTM
jgi:hypothetical protein